MSDITNATKPEYIAGLESIMSADILIKICSYLKFKNIRFLKRICKTMYEMMHSYEFVQFIELRAKTVIMYTWHTYLNSCSLGRLLVPHEIWIREKYSATNPLVIQFKLYARDLEYIITYNHVDYQKAVSSIQRVMDKKHVDIPHSIQCCGHVIEWNNWIAEHYNIYAVNAITNVVYYSLNKWIHTVINAIDYVEPDWFFDIEYKTYKQPQMDWTEKNGWIPSAYGIYNNHRLNIRTFIYLYRVRNWSIDRVIEEWNVNARVKKTHFIEEYGEWQRRKNNKY